MYVLYPACIEYTTKKKLYPSNKNREETKNRVPIKQKRTCITQI